MWVDFKKGGFPHIATFGGKPTLDYSNAFIIYNHSNVDDILESFYIVFLITCFLDQSWTLHWGGGGDLCLSMNHLSPIYFKNCHLFMQSTGVGRETDIL